MVDLAIIISYPTIASGIIVNSIYLKKTTNFQLVFNFEQTRTITIIFGEHGIMANIP